MSESETDPGAPGPHLVEGEPQLPPPEELRDLGFGTRVAEQSRQRLLNADGTFNVYRRGLSVLGAVDPFHRLLTIRWSTFLAWSFAIFLLVNAFFGAGYYFAGPEALRVAYGIDVPHRMANAFFFSVETFTTVGYGHLAPGNTAANLLMTCEVFISLLLTALLTGLFFARFSRPRARIGFSRRAVIAPYRGGTAFEFRMANKRRSELTSLQCVVVLAILEEDRHGNRKRRFHSLTLERPAVAFFPLAWTVVHPIDDDSPLWGLTAEDLVTLEAEFLVLVTAIDDALSQTTQTRTSYRGDEVVWGARFCDMFMPADGGPLRIDVGLLDGFDHVPLPAPPARAAG